MPGRFVIAVKDLAAGGSDFAFPLTESWLRTALAGCEVGPAENAEGRLDVRATHSGTDVLLQGAVRVDLVATCVRCLELASVRVDTTFSILMTPSSTAGGEEGDDDPDRDTFDGDEIVLDDIAREQILLEVPMNPLCSESCAGVALTDTGAVRVDPRLAPLAALRKKL